MPTRLLREGILDSDRIDQLDAAAEVFYRRLMSKVDDYGLFDARHALLRTSLYALRVDRVREADIARWIAACEKAGVIALYEHAGKPYGQMLDTKWQVRSEPKHPLPPWGKGEPSRTGENNRSQPGTPATVFGVGVGVETPKPPTGGFDVFWALWPKHTRKVAEKQCREKWRTQGCDAIAERVIAAVKVAIKSEAWAKDKGKFIPAPLVWLNQNRWEAPTDDEVSGDTGEWFETWAGVKAKGVELGIPWSEDGWVAGEHMSIPVYRAKVFSAAGHSPRAAA